MAATVTDIAALPFVSIDRCVDLPNDSAVYFITGPDFVPLYIGESVRMKNRLTGHPTKAVAKTLGADRVAWLLVPKERRIQVELEFIRLHLPPLNKAGTPTDKRLGPRRPGRPAKPKPE
jgi:excinuclease UvrABC nuclease subunit